VQVGEAAPDRAKVRMPLHFAYIEEQRGRNRKEHSLRGLGFGVWGLWVGGGSRDWRLRVEVGSRD
jgi:hypothetical protein